MIASRRCGIDIGALIGGLLVAMLQFLPRQAVPSLAKVFSLQVSYFSRYISKSRAKRLPLNTKRAGKGYYKGKGARKEGHNTSTGRIILPVN